MYVNKSLLKKNSDSKKTVCEYCIKSIRSHSRIFESIDCNIM